MKVKKFEKIITDLRLNDFKDVEINAYQKMYLDVLQAEFSHWKDIYEKDEIAPWDIKTIIQNTRRKLLTDFSEIDKHLSC